MEWKYLRNQLCGSLLDTFNCQTFVKVWLCVCEYVSSICFGSLSVGAQRRTAWMCWQERIGQQRECVFIWFRLLFYFEEMSSNESSKLKEKKMWNEQKSSEFHGSMERLHRDERTSRWVKSGRGSILFWMTDISHTVWCACACVCVCSTIGSFMEIHHRSKIHINWIWMTLFFDIFLLVSSPSLSRRSINNHPIHYGLVFIISRFIVLEKRWREERQKKMDREREENRFATKWTQQKTEKNPEKTVETKQKWIIQMCVLRCAPAHVSYVCVSVRSEWRNNGNEYIARSYRSIIIVDK